MTSNADEILFWGNHAHVAHCLEGCTGVKCDCSCHWPSADGSNPDFCQHEFVDGSCKKCRISERDTQPAREQQGQDELRERARELCEREFRNVPHVLMVCQSSEKKIYLWDVMAAFASSIQEEALPSAEKLAQLVWEDSSKSLGVYNKWGDVGEADRVHHLTTAYAYRKVLKQLGCGIQEEARRQIAELNELALCGHPYKLAYTASGVPSAIRCALCDKNEAEQQLAEARAHCAHCTCECPECKKA